MARSKSIALVKKNAPKRARKHCHGCVMVEENAIWERTFSNWSILSHRANSLPLDRAGLVAIEALMAHKPETRSVFKTVGMMLETAVNGETADSLHFSRVSQLIDDYSSDKSVVKLKNRQTAFSRNDPELHGKLVDQYIKKWQFEIADYLIEQSDIAFAIARSLADLAPFAQRGEVAIADIKKPNLSKTFQDRKLIGVEHAIAVVKDRRLYDLVHDGLYSAGRIRREVPIVVFLRFTTVGVSALALQMDGNEINVADWCCIAIDDEDALLATMSETERQRYQKTSPELRSYISALVGNLDLEAVPPTQEAPLTIADTTVSVLERQPKVEAEAEQQIELEQVQTLPEHDAAPATPIDDLIAAKLEPVLAQLAATEDELAFLKARIPIRSAYSKDEQIAVLEKTLDEERSEFMQLIKIAEREKDDAISESASLRAALQAQTRSDVSRTLPMTFPASLAELEPWAIQQLLGRVFIMPRAYRAMRKVVYTDTERACRALLLLAGPYLDAKNGVDGANDRFLEGLKELKLIDKPQQTIGGAIKVAEYYISYHGERIFLDKHIRGKDGRFNDDKLLRIYYHYHAATNQILIGHMPSHLTTAAGR